MNAHNFTVGNKVVFLEGTDDEVTGVIAKIDYDRDMVWVVSSSGTSFPMYCAYVKLVDEDVVEPVKHTFVFNPGAGGAEAMSITTIVEDIGTEDQLIRQELVLQSNFRSTTFHMPYDLNPFDLRKLANELEVFMINLSNR